VEHYSLAFQENFIRPVLDNKVSKVVQFSFPKGKVLQKHKTSSAILVQVLSGKVKFEAGEERILEPLQMVSLPPNVEHSVEALEESIMLLTLTPSPSMHTILRPTEAEHHSFGPEAKGSIAPQLQSFVEEHEELLQVLDQALGGYKAAAYETADRMIAEELEKHFRYEEDFLFPLLGKYIGTDVGPIAVMLAEHRTIRNLHGQFHQYLEQLGQGTQSESEVVEVFEPLEDVLRTHITKEDNVLFPLASRVMSEEDRNEVARLVKQANA
jgi:hemerythrin-like domain-containing protein/quercetin dioxygenase-like cupin family protein